MAFPGPGKWLQIQSTAETSGAWINKPENIQTLKEYNIYVSEKFQVQQVQANSYNYKVLIHNQFKNMFIKLYRIEMI